MSIQNQTKTSPYQVGETGSKEIADGTGYRVFGASSWTNIPTLRGRSHDQTIAVTVIGNFDCYGLLIGHSDINDPGLDDVSNYEFLFPAGERTPVFVPKGYDLWITNVSSTPVTIFAREEASN